MKIPNAEHAIVDIRKLQEYSLNPQHRIGKNKARVFASALGVTINDAEALRNILLKVIKEYDIRIRLKDSYGQRYKRAFLRFFRSKRGTIVSVTL